MIKMVKSKKGQVQQLQSLVIPLVAIGIVLAIGFLILAEVGVQVADKDTTQNPTNLSTCNSSACNGTKEVMGAIDDIPGWLPIIIITVIGAILIGLVSLFRGGKR